MNLPFQFSSGRRIEKPMVVETYPSTSQYAGPSRPAGTTFVDLIWVGASSNVEKFSLASAWHRTVGVAAGLLNAAGAAPSSGAETSASVTAWMNAKTIRTVVLLHLERSEPGCNELVDGKSRP